MFYSELHLSRPRRQRAETPNFGNDFVGVHEISGFGVGLT